MGRSSGRAVLGDVTPAFGLGVAAPCEEGDGVRVSGCKGGSEFLGWLGKLELKSN